MLGGTPGGSSGKFKVSGRTRGNGADTVSGRTDITSDRGSGVKYISRGTITGSTSGEVGSYSGTSSLDCICFASCSTSSGTGTTSVRRRGTLECVTASTLVMVSTGSSTYFTH